LRSLDPKTEQHLFQTAYFWRNKPKKNRLSFEDFAKDDPSQITLGLFNGELQAVYFFHEIAPNVMQAHFTSSRKTDKSLVLAGARTLVQWFEQNDLQMVAYIHKRNTVLRRFVEDVGLVGLVDTEKSCCQNDTDGGTVSPTTQLWVEYRSGMVPFIGPQRQKANDTRHDG
jgi:hypothetical protein